jgi:hypothetical protein
MDKEPTLPVGVDWASKAHQVCMIGGGAPQQSAVAPDADELGAMVAWLIDQAARGPARSSSRLKRRTALASKP